MLDSPLIQIDVYPCEYSSNGLTYIQYSIYLRPILPYTYANDASINAHTRVDQEAKFSVCPRPNCSKQYLSPTNSM